MQDLLSLARAALLLFVPLLLLAVVPAASDAQSAPAASEAMFKQMLIQRAEYASSPGQTKTVTIHEFHIDRPVRWTQEFGNSPSQDNTTLVYKVRARFTVTTRSFNTATEQVYGVYPQEYRRRYNYYIDRNGRWVAQSTGTTADWH